MKFLLPLLFLSVMVSSAQAFDMKVLSWNVYMLPKPIKKSLQKTRTRVIPEQLKDSDHDLILLQEAFPSSFRSKVRGALKESHPYTYYLKLPSFPYPVFGSGVYFLSRYPFRVLDHVYFNHCTSADCFASKGAALVALTLPGGKTVHVVSTHLQATDGAGKIRLGQLSQIRSMLDRHRRKDTPEFLMGDLNIDQNDPEFELGLAIMGMDYSRLTGPILSTSSRVNECYKTGKESKWIDHMWYDQYSGVDAAQMQVKVYDFERNGKICPSSDHQAVEASFYF